MLAAGFEKLSPKSLLAKRGGDAVAKVPTECAEVIIQFMADTAAAYDDAIEESVEHGVWDFIIGDMTAVKLIGEFLEVGFMCHAFAPGKGVPVG